MNYTCDNLYIFIKQNMDVEHAAYLKMEVNSDTIIGLNKMNKFLL
jgi:hypothetical protein